MLDAVGARSGASTAAERDFVLSFGERMSARVVAARLRAAGLPATPVDAFDLGLDERGQGRRDVPRDGPARASRARCAPCPASRS